MKKSYVKLMWIFVLFVLVVANALAEKILMWTWYYGPATQILKDLFEKDFTSKTGIEVEILTVPIEDMTNKLLLAYLSGDAPDVVELYSNTAVELGIRGALTNLNTFKSIKKVTADINPLLLPALQYKSALFAVPGEVNWTWTYYRTDIFNEIGLEAPKTWDDFRDATTKLKARNMDSYYYYQGDPTALIVGKLLPFVYQRNSDIYTQDGTASNLDSSENIAAFKELTRLHTEYKLPLDDPSFTTFASGETPLQLQQNWYYCAFEVAAPQIIGKWDIAPFPGIKQKDGSIDNTNTGKMLVWSIVSSSKKQQASWKLIEYISSSEFTTQFMNQVYKIEKSRLFFSNKNSIDKANFPKAHIALARKSLKDCRMQTAVIGGPIANRYIDFAFNKVVLQGDDPETAIKQAAKESTLEIQKKLKEFARFIKQL